MLKPSEDLTGSVVHGYVVLERIGDGSSATVYRAVDSDSGNRMVALKVMHGTEQRIRSVLGNHEHPFERELRLVKAIDDPRLIRVYEVGNLEDGRFFVSMEYVSGSSLGSEMEARGPIPWQEALAVWLEVVAAVSAFHQMHVIHRDISPNNVLIRYDSDGKTRIKLIDFGLARLRHERDDSEGVDVIGTPLYMAPEQAQAQGSSTQSDVYSLGAVLYEMISGKPVIPLKRPSSHACVEYLRSPKPLPAIPMKSLVTEPPPPGLIKLIDQCLSRKITDRPLDAMTLAEQASRFSVKNNEPTDSLRKGGIAGILHSLFGRKKKERGGFTRD